MIRHTDRSVRVLVGGVLINRAGSFFSTFLVLFLRQQAFSLRQIPAVLFFVGVAIPTGSLLGGWAADRFSRRTALIVTTSLAGASLVVVGVAPNRIIEITGVFSAALFAQAYLPAASALLIDHSQERDRVPIFAFFRLALNVGAAVGPIIAAFVAPHGLQRLFLLDAATYFAFVVVLVVGLRAPNPPLTAADPAAERILPSVVAGSIRGISPGLVFFFVAVLGTAMVYAQYSSTVSLAVSTGRSTASYAALLSLNGFLVIALELPVSSLTRKMPFWKPMLLGAICVSSGIAVCIAVHSYALVVLGVLVWTTGEMLCSPVMNSAVAAFSPPGRTGRYQGYLSTLQSVGFAAGPALGTLVYSYSRSVLWCACLVVGALVCGAVGLASRFAPRVPQITSRQSGIETGLVVGVIDTSPD